jgi:MFS family permease
MAHLREKGIQRVKAKCFGKLDGNALVYAETEPIWAIIAGLALYYFPMYMKDLGVTEVQMGLLNAVTGVFGALTALVSGPIIDRYGRRTTTVIFNIFAWSFTMAIWALAQNYYYFLLAAIVNAFVKIPSIAGNCLVVEDTPTNRRSYYFSFIILVNLASGLFTPITGVAIKYLGLVPTMRLVYLLAFLITMSLFLMRYRLVKETKVGKKLMMSQKKISIRKKARDYCGAAKCIINNRLTLTTFIIVLLINFQIGFGFFAIVYLSDVLMFPVSIISKLPVIAALANLLAYFIIMPKFYKRDETYGLVAGIILSVLGAGIFLIIRPNNYLLLFLSTIIGAVGNMIMFIFRDTLWSNVIDEKQRTNVLSECQAFISLMAVPSGILSGTLYGKNPIIPFIVVFIVLIATLGCSIYALRVKRKAAVKKL